MGPVLNASLFLESNLFSETQATAQPSKAGTLPNACGSLFFVGNRNNVLSVGLCSKRSNKTVEVDGEDHNRKTRLESRTGVDTVDGSHNLVT